MPPPMPATLQLEFLGWTPPDQRFLFVAALLLHIAAGATATVTGALAAFSRKRRGRHSGVGTVYRVAATIGAATVAVMAVMRWPDTWPLFVVAMVTVSLAWLGFVARRQRWRRWMAWHGSAMGLSYVGLLTGFLVVNGDRLSPGDLLPPVTYWTVSAVVGVPVTVWALARNRALPLRRRRVARRA